MELGFNFNDFYKEMQAKSEVPLNYAGVDLDQATESSEWITNNVLYYVSHIWADGVLYDGNYRLLVRVDDDEDPDEYHDYFVRQWESIDPLLEADVTGDWIPGRDRENTIVLDSSEDAVSYFILEDSDHSDTIVTAVTEVTLIVFPKYEAITNDIKTVMSERFPSTVTDTDPGLYEDINQNVIGSNAENWPKGNNTSYNIKPGSNLPTYMRCMYGLLGLYGGDRSKSLRWMFGSRYGMWRIGSSAVVSRSRFNRWINNLTDRLADNNIGVKVEVYDDAYAKEVTVEDATKEDYRRNKRAARLKHRTYRRAVRDSDWTRTKMTRRTSFQTAYTKELPKFLAKFGNGENGQADFVQRMSYADGNTQDAVIPSMRDVFKAWYYDASELEDEFNDNFQTVVDGMSKVPLGWRTVGGSIRDTLFEIAGRYKEFPTTITIEDDEQKDIKIPASDRVGIDLSYILNQMAMGGYSLDGPETGYKYYYPRVIQRGGYEITDPDQYGMGGFSEAYVGVDEYTTTSFSVSWKDDKYKYDLDMRPSVVHVPPQKSKKPKVWFENSSYRYSSNITECVDVNGKRQGSSDFVRQGAPADILRTRAVSEGVSGEEIKSELTDYFNYLLSKNKDYSDLSVTVDDYVLTANNGAIETSDVSEVAGDDPDTIKEKTVKLRYRQFMFWTACYLNYLAENGFAKTAADAMMAAITENGTLEATLLAMASQGYRRQPRFGEKVDMAGNIVSGEVFTYDVIQWESCSSTDSIVWHPVPLYEERWNVPSEGIESIGPLVDSVEIMYDAYVTMLRNLPSTFLRYGFRAVMNTIRRLRDISDDFADLLRTVYRIRVYQMFAQESVFTNKSMVGLAGMKYAFRGKMETFPDDPDPFSAYSAYAPMWNMPARLMIPIQAYKKVRRRYKRWGRTRHRMVWVPIGVRWAEVQFIDTNVYSAYPQVDVAPGKDVAIESEVTVTQEGSSYRYTFADDLPEEVQSAETITLYTGVAGNSGVNGEYSGLSLYDSNVLSGTDGPGPGVYYVPKVRIPLPRSQRDDTKHAITVHYNMPHLPYDSEMRQKAFLDYGPLSQDRLFSITRNGDGGYGTRGEVRHDGWTIFHESSSSIRDLRCGVSTRDDYDPATGEHTLTQMCGSLGIHEKVALLVRILKEEFGSDKVRLIETYRSKEDQASMCMGSNESSFLSWHNYGLAAKILIYEDDLSTPVGLYGEEFKRMIPIARAFTEACYNGSIGEPCNVVWCRRLLVGPSMFDWEFLPIGVGHKDAPKFREDTVNLMDPMVERAYVDVDTAKYVKMWKKPDRDYQLPYILQSSKAYANAITIGGNHYVSPDRIKNIPHVNDIVLYDAKEYINLIQLKMDAHGTNHVPGVDMFTWRSLNPISCGQLVRYFSMIGNLPGAKALLAGSYYDQYNYITTMFYASDPVRYVKEMLGDRYADAAITIDMDGDSSYITLKDGLLHIKAQDSYPDMPSSDQDRFKSKQATPDRMLRGNWYDGKFYTYDERPIQEVVSPNPIIDGYQMRDGEWYPVNGDAVAVHTIIATQIKKEYDAIAKTFTDYKGVLMYDRIEDSPNSELSDMLENEFGLIAAQDLIDFDDMEDEIAKDVINEANRGNEGDVYEKVVDHAEVAGLKLAELTREHIHINDRHPGVTIEELYRRLTEKGYTANTLLK